MFGRKKIEPKPIAVVNPEEIPSESSIESQEEEESEISKLRKELEELKRKPREIKEETESESEEITEEKVFNALAEDRRYLANHEARLQNLEAYLYKLDEIVRSIKGFINR